MTSGKIADVDMARIVLRMKACAYIGLQQQLFLVSTAQIMLSCLYIIY